MGNPDFGATVTDFIAILQSIDYSKFERFSNVADEISTKLVSGFFECEALVAFTDGYDFEFSIEAAERKRRTATQIISRKLKLLIAKNFQKHFKVSLEIRTIKPTCSNNLSKRRETLPKVLTSFQTNYLANLDGATCRVSHRSKRLIFIATTKKLTRKCLSISNSFMIIFVWTESLFRQTVMLQVISLYQGVTNFTYLDALWFKTGTCDDISLYTH